MADSTLGYPDRKKRKVLSCYDCRRRKQKCGREFPICSRCRKAGLGSSCTYDPLPLTAPNSTRFKNSTDGADIASNDGPSQNYPQNSADFVTHDLQYDVPTELTSMKARISNLEARTSTLETQDVIGFPRNAVTRNAIEISNIPSMPELGDDVQKATSSTLRDGDLKGRGFRTEFHGPTGPWGSISQLRSEVRPLMVDAEEQNATLKSLIHVIDALEDNADAKRENSKKAVTPFDLFNLLPKNPLLHELLELYFLVFGNTYRVLHGPTFWSSYERLCRDPSSADSQFVVIVLLCCASVRCAYIGETPRMIGDQSLANFVADGWLKACEEWLHTTKWHPRSIVDYQIRCLLVLAKKANFIRMKGTWNEAGSLLQMGLSAGLHREPNLIRGSTSAFHKEMRRRIWATMVNLELEISIERGMPSLSTLFFCDSAPPLNINDEDFDESTEILPAPKLENEYTSVSFLRQTLQTMSLRASINASLNDKRRNLTYEDVLKYHEEIEHQLTNIPQWSTQADEQLRAASIVPRAMLDIQLRQFLLMLHRPFIKERKYSLVACLDAATVIIEYHTRLSGAGNFGLTLIRRDILRAALSICECFFKDSLAPDNALQLIPSALDWFENKVIRFGHGLRSYWLLQTVCDILRRREVVSLPQLLRQPLKEKLIAMYRKMLDLQEDTVTRDQLMAQEEFKESSTTGSTILSQNVQEPQFYNSLANSIGGDALFGNLELPGWMYEDLQLFNLDFNAPLCSS